MDTILTNPAEDSANIIGTMIELMAEQTEVADTYPEQLLDDYVLSLWVKEKNIVRPSGDIKVSSVLEPGVYTVEFDRELGIFCEKTTAPSDELFIFSDSVTESVLQEIDLFWDKRELYKQNNLMHKRGILFEGFPGTGKSALITQISNRTIDKKGVIFKVSGFRNLNHYVTFIRTAFRKIQPDTPIITILEDINQYAEVEPEMLDFLDGKTNIDHHIVIATSNNTEDIPEAFLRPSRIDLRIEIGLPSRQTRLEYFQFKNVPENQLHRLVDQTDKFTLADLKEVYICVFLLDYTLDDALSKILLPKDKKNYSQHVRRAKKMGL